MVWLRGLEQQVGETFLLTALGKISVERGAKNNYSDFRWNLLEINEPELAASGNQAISHSQSLL